MGRKGRSAPTKLITMKIDEELYLKSKCIIQNRTQDYEDYLRRRINVQNRAELIKIEIEELDDRKDQLMHEFDIEMGLVQNQVEETKIKESDLESAIKIVNRIMDRGSGVIGLDRLEDIANLKEVSVSELKQAIPSKNLVKYHPQFKEKVGVGR